MGGTSPAVIYPGVLTPSRDVIAQGAQWKYFASQRTRAQKDQKTGSKKEITSCFCSLLLETEEIFSTTPWLEGQFPSRIT